MVYQTIIAGVAYLAGADAQFELNNNGLEGELGGEYQFVMPGQEALSGIGVGYSLLEQDLAGSLYNQFGESGLLENAVYGAANQNPLEGGIYQASLDVEAAEEPEKPEEPPANEPDDDDDDDDGRGGNDGNSGDKPQGDKPGSDDDNNN